MINVLIHCCEKRFALFARGHADYAPYGQDVVCAGVSALIYALAGTVLEMEDEGLFARVPFVKMSPGKACIVAWSGERSLERVKGAFQTVEAGLSLIAGDYPENLRLKIQDAGMGRKESREHEKL